MKKEIEEMNNSNKLSQEEIKAVRDSLTRLDLGFAICTDEEIENIAEEQMLKIKADIQTQEQRKVEKRVAKLKTELEIEADKEAQKLFEAEKQRLLKSAEATREEQIQFSIERMQKELDRVIANLQARADDVCQKITTAIPGIINVSALKEKIDCLIQTYITNVQKEAKRLEVLAKLKQDTDSAQVPVITDHAKSSILLYEWSVAEQIEVAIEILGKENVFGPKEIEKALGIKVKPEQIPEIPFTREELERAKELNQFLILRVDKANDGKPLTIAKMNELLKGKVKGGTRALNNYGGSGKIDDSWYKGQDFVLKETPKLSWALTSKEVIPDSTSKNYLDQTTEMVNYLRNDVFKGKEIPAEFQRAIAEFEKAKDEIAMFMNNNKNKAAGELERLAITKLTRQTPVEALYDIFIYFQNKGERLFENMYIWTSRRASAGKLVRVGDFDADGASVPRDTPDYSSGNLGVAFSRSL